MAGIAVAVRKDSGITSLAQLDGNLPMSQALRNLYQNPSNRGI